MQKINDIHDVVIFGTNDLAELAHYYLRHDSPYRVVAFTVDRQYIPESKIFKNLPVVPFDELLISFPPTKTNLFAPLIGRKMNGFRESIFKRGKELGYTFISYISSKASTFNTMFGENCFILEDNTIQPFVKVGDNVIMWSGNHIGHHSKIGSHVFFTSHVVLSGHCNVEDNAWLGVNSTIRDGITIGKGSLVAMSASVVKNTEPNGVYMGLPAKKLENKTALEANP